MNRENTRRLQGVEPLWSTYIHAKAARLGIPLSGNFELTARCNFNCKMCYIHDGQPPREGELTAEEWLSIAKTARDNGMVFLLLTGGEPLIRKDFREIYKGLKELGLLISINTNASLITEDYVEFFRKDPPLRMNISLYGGCGDTYRALCGVDAFETVTRHIRALHEAGIQIRLNASLTPLNRADVPAIYAFGEELGIPVKGTAYMFPPTRIEGKPCENGYSRFTPEEAAACTLECREQFLTAEELAAGVKDLPRDPAEDCADGQGEKMRCRAGKTAFWITWDGRMLPCGMFPCEGIWLADTPFVQAWEATKTFVADITLPRECTDCPLRDQCPACAASCLAESGDTAVCPPYVCTMTKSLARMTADTYARKQEGEFP